MCEYRRLTCLLEKVTSRFLQTNFFEIVAIPTVNPPTYSLIDVEKEEISGKFYEKELSLIGNKADYNKNGQ